MADRMSFRETMAAAKAETEAKRVAKAHAKYEAMASDPKLLAKQAAEYAASPVGQAEIAYEDGHGFFEVQLTVGSSQRDVSFGMGDFSKRTTTAQHAGTLSAIEAVGWRLEHVGYVFQVTGESSRDKFLASGQNVAVSGQTVGIYLFRRAD